MDIETLRLVDEGTTISGHVHQLALLQLPHRLVQRLQFLRNVQTLETGVPSNTHLQIAISSNTRHSAWLAMLISLVKLVSLANLDRLIHSLC